MISYMYKNLRSHLPQFLRYLGGGGSAAAIELTSYKLLLWAGMWYLAAAFTSGMLGLGSAFLFHKYFVFQKKDRTRRQVVRYALLQGWNALAQTGLVYVFVEFFSVEPFLAKILGIGCTVLWNFFLYKFFVYV